MYVAQFDDLQLQLQL